MDKYRYFFVLDLGAGNEEHAFEVLSAFRKSVQLKTALVKKLPKDVRGECDVYVCNH